MKYFKDFGYALMLFVRSNVFLGLCDYFSALLLPAFGFLTISMCKKVNNFLWR